MSDESLTDAELAELESLTDAASPAPWIAEYGPAIGGPDFIMITDWDSDQPDMYVMHDDHPAPVSDLRFIAAARNTSLDWWRKFGAAAASQARLLLRGKRDSAADTPGVAASRRKRRSRPWPGTRWAVRHLRLEQAAAALKRGKPVEQLLPSEPHDGQPTVRWLAIESSRDSFVVRLHHVYDEGSPDALPVDVSEFTPVDDDEYWGEGVKVARSPHPDGALEAARDHGATNERWVNFGVIADEYSDARGWT